MFHVCHNENGIFCIRYLNRKFYCNDIQFNCTCSFTIVRLYLSIPRVILQKFIYYYHSVGIYICRNKYYLNGGNNNYGFKILLYMYRFHAVISSPKRNGSLKVSYDCAYSTWLRIIHELLIVTVSRSQTPL